MTEKSVVDRLEIKNLKTWNTDDGGGYECSLWFDGIRIGTAVDFGRGGAIEVTFLPRPTNCLTRPRGTFWTTRIRSTATISRSCTASRMATA